MLTQVRLIITGNSLYRGEEIVVSDFNLGDRVEILFHLNNDYKGRLGQITFIGAGLLQGTNPLDYNIDIPNQEHRFFVTLDDNTLLDDVQAFQLRKM